MLWGTDLLKFNTAYIPGIKVEIVYEATNKCFDL